MEDLEEIGLALGIRKSAIEEILKRKPTSKLQLKEVVYYWLKRKDIIRLKKDIVPSWGQLVDAVADVSKELSRRISDKYCHN